MRRVPPVLWALGAGLAAAVLLARRGGAATVPRSTLPLLPPPGPAPRPASLPRGSSGASASAPVRAQVATVRASGTSTVLGGNAPSNYAASNLGKLSRWWGGAAGEAVRAYTPQIFPDVPPQAVLGFCAISMGPTEDTGAPRPDGSIPNRSFHEIGLFQTPAGPSSGPAPAAASRYAAFGRSAAFEQLTGHTADLAPGAWRTRIEDQVGIGLFDLVDGLRQLAERLQRSSDLDLWTSSAQLQWAAACDAFSAGPAGAARVLEPVAPLLVGAGTAPVLAWIRGICDLWDSPEANREIFPVVRSGMNPHHNIAYSTLRTWQKWECGRVLARDTGGDVSWFDLGIDSAAQAALEARLVTAARGR